MKVLTVFTIAILTLGFSTAYAVSVSKEQAGLQERGSH